MSRITPIVKWLLIGLFLVPAAVFAGTAEPDGSAAALREVQQYNFAIHILAMLLVGFGFLMVFVQRYGYSATTGTYLVVAVGLPVYFVLRSMGLLTCPCTASRGCCWQNSP